MTAPPPVLYATTNPGPPVMPPLRQFTVDEYHRMCEAGILPSGEKVELLNGYLVTKMTIHPPHVFSLQAVSQLIMGLLRGGWEVRTQVPITLTQSEPEPDVAVARGTRHTYMTRHPGPADLGLVVEVADSSLTLDQTFKGPIYGAAGIPGYWIIDVIHRQVEVYTLTSAGYGPPTLLTPGQALPLILDGVHLGDLAVADLFV